MKLTRYLVPAAALAAISAAWAAPAQAKVWSNTQIRLPQNAYLGDIDGDGNQDFIYVRGSAVYVTTSDYWGTKILYSPLTLGSTISRVFTGDFVGSGADQICVIHLASIPARGCKRMYWEVPGGHGVGSWTYDIYIDDVEPVDINDVRASIHLECPASFDDVCYVSRQ
jgi:hypothetical protein